MRRWVVPVGSWVSATFVATALVWTGVLLVTSDIVEEHTVPLAPDDVSGLLDVGVGVGDDSIAAAPLEAPSAPTATPTTASVAAPLEAAPPARVALPAAPAVGTFPTTGGSVSVSCDGDVAALTSARPADGWQVAVLDGGPDRVVVQFRSPRGDETVVVVCRGGAPVLAGTSFDGHDGEQPTGDRYGDDPTRDRDGDRFGDGDGDDGFGDGGHDGRGDGEFSRDGDGR